MVVPIYEYRCANGHEFELFQRMSDPAPAGCVECEAPVQKVLTAPAIHYKGSGFYATDYGRGKKAKADAKAESNGSSSSDSSAAASSGSTTSSSSASSSAPSTSSGGSSATKSAAD